MSIKDRARERAAQEALNRSTGGTCDDSQCVVHIINAAHFGFDAGREAAVREFIEKMGYAKGTGAFIGMENEFRKMFGKELDG